MNRVHFSAKSDAYMSAELQERISSFNTRASAWQTERERVELKATTAQANPSVTWIDNQRVVHGPETWIGPRTFGDGAAVLAFCDESRRRRLALPVEGQNLMDELTKIRVAAQKEWAAHIERLMADLASVEADATKEVAKLRISDSAKTAHIADATAAARRAANVECPCPTNWPGWNPAQLDKFEHELAADLRAAVARYL